MIQRLLTSRDEDLTEGPDETEVELLKAYQENDGGVNLSETVSYDTFFRQTPNSVFFIL